MTEFKRMFLDTSPLIYIIDNDENFCEKTISIIETAIENNTELVTSAITCEEYLVHAYKSGSERKKKAFYDFLETCNVNTLQISMEIADKAAQIRADYKGFKAMDALQLASAVISGCDVFFTNDKQLRQFKELKVITIDDYEI